MIAPVSGRGFRQPGFDGIPGGAGPSTSPLTIALSLGTARATSRVGKTTPYETA